MRRREMLTALGSVAGHSGCLSSGLLGDGDVQRTVSLVNQGFVGTDHDVEIGVDILESRITDRHTARLQITTTNDGPARTLSIGSDVCALFSRGEGGSDEPPGLRLYTPDRAAEFGREDNRWRRTPLRPGYIEISTPFSCPTEYEPNESLSNEYVIWQDNSVEGYLEPDTYRWAEEVAIWNGEDDGESADKTITWGFALRLEKPD